MANKPEDWTAIATRLSALAEDMMEQAKYAPDELDGHMITLWARSLSHSAIEMRFFAGAIAPIEGT